MNNDNQLEVTASPKVPEAPAVTPAGAADPAPTIEVATGAPAEVPTPPVDVDGVAREAVRQTLGALGITAGGESSKLRELTGAVDTLSRLPPEFRTQLDAVFAAVLDRVEDKKGHFAFNRQRRLFLDLLSLHDMIRDLENGTADPSHHANYGNLLGQLVQLLALNDVTPIVCEVGTAFNPSQHRVVRVVQTEEGSLDGCIESVARDGFAYGSFVVRPAEVVVHKRSAANSGQTQ
jgi:molecular chaperone GrpE (heat shock protein)